MDVIKTDFDLEKNILTRKVYEEANLLMYVEYCMLLIYTSAFPPQALLSIISQPSPSRQST